MMHHTIPERRGGNDAMLGIEHLDLDIGARAVAILLQLTLQPQEFAFEIDREGGSARLLPFGE
jgi:hypothetical protein